MQTITGILSSPWFLIGWAALMLPSLVSVIRDLRSKNAHLMSLMRLDWCLTVVYSGLLGLLIYLNCGRKEIPRDTLWRRAFRSVAHCYSGCGAGEVVGLILAVGLFQLGNTGIAALTFAMAYVAGYALTVGPLVEKGVPVRTAIRDAVLSETPSIAVMEIVAISVDLMLSGKAGLGDPLFWSSMIVSLTLGFIAAYPVNVALIHWNVKEGMMDPRHTHHGGHEDRPQGTQSTG
ncbi:DUF4396 domain-containing protein [Primorskyibacter sp. 2E107]|uniref:DUF4396 domain-containing protein n=1 Tax=Primorskyibacter sp. 2E107 TaxID=3403458 RepID=UPI003AF96DA2